MKQWKVKYPMERRKAEGREGEGGQEYGIW